MDVEELMMRSKTESAVDTIEAHISKAHANLLFVERALVSELGAGYPMNINPYQLIVRIKNIEQQLPLLAEQCQKLSAEKQDLIDFTKSSLVQNRTSLRRLQARAGLLVVDDKEDEVFCSFTEILKEWNSQFRQQSRKDYVPDNEQVIAPHDLNVKLFQSKITVHETS